MLYKSVINIIIINKARLKILRMQWIHHSGQISNPLIWMQLLGNQLQLDSVPHARSSNFRFSACFGQWVMAELTSLCYLSHLSYLHLDIICSLMPKSEWTFGLHESGNSLAVSMAISSRQCTVVILKRSRLHSDEKSNLANINLILVAGYSHPECNWKSTSTDFV